MFCSVFLLIIGGHVSPPPHPPPLLYATDHNNKVKLFCLIVLPHVDTYIFLVFPAEKAGIPGFLQYFQPSGKYAYLVCILSCKWILCISI